MRTVPASMPRWLGCSCGPFMLYLNLLACLLCRSGNEPLSLGTVHPGQIDSLQVSQGVIRQSGWVLDIVTPTSRRCNCFTRKYSQYAKVLLTLVMCCSMCALEYMIWVFWMCKAEMLQSAAVLAIWHILQAESHAHGRLSASMQAAIAALSARQSSDKA